MTSSIENSQKSIVSIVDSSEGHCHCVSIRCLYEVVYPLDPRQCRKRQTIQRKCTAGFFCLEHPTLFCFDDICVQLNLKSKVSRGRLLSYLCFAKRFLSLARRTVEDIKFLTSSDVVTLQTLGLILQIINKIFHSISIYYQVKVFAKNLNAFKV